MTYRSYLSRSPSGSFYFRLRLAPAVAEKLGVKELRRSLQTSDRIQARTKALELFQVVRQLSLSAHSSEVLQPLLERLEATRAPLQKDIRAERKSLPVEEGMVRYRAENAHLWTEKTAQEVESILSRFEVCSSTGRADAVRHKARLAHLHPKTQNKHLKRLHGVFEYLRINGYVRGENPFEGLTLRLRPFCLEAEARTVWSDAD